MPSVKFVKNKKAVAEIQVEPGTNLRRAAMQAGVDVYAGIHKYLHCPGLGLCTTCLMHVRQGSENLSPPSVWEKVNVLKCAIPLFPPYAFFSRLEHGQQTTRLSCQTRVHGDVEVEATPRFNWHGEKFWG